METVMMKSPLVLTFLLYVLGSANAVTMSFTEKKSISASGTTKMATCDITVSIEAGVVNKPASSVKCTISWPKAKALSKTASIAVIVGDVNSQPPRLLLVSSLSRPMVMEPPRPRPTTPPSPLLTTGSAMETPLERQPTPLICGVPRRTRLSMLTEELLSTRVLLLTGRSVLSCAPPMSMMLAMLPASPGHSTTLLTTCMVWSLESADCCPTLVSTDWMLLESSLDTTSAGELGAPVSSHRSSLLLSLVLVTVFTHGYLVMVYLL